jgi:hypothetical protein
MKATNSQEVKTMKTQTETNPARKEAIRNQIEELKTLAAHTPTPWITWRILEARRKSWHGNFAGYRIFADGEMVIDHVNVLREEEALEKAKEILKQRHEAIARAEGL